MLEGGAALGNVMPQESIFPGTLMARRIAGPVPALAEMWSTFCPQTKRTVEPQQVRDCTNRHFALPRQGVHADLLLRALNVFVLFLAFSTAIAATPPSFNRDIRPILSGHCLKCHGPDAQIRKGKLRLDLETEAKRSAIDVSHPDQSELVRRITSSDPEFQMPPPTTGKALSPQQVQMLRDWVQHGARYEKHWSFEPIFKPNLPGQATPAAAEIDRFIASALQARGLSLSAPIPPWQWIRRATFDLTGLPPTWEEVRAFVEDPSPDAREKVIDRLLSSPGYGERWGRLWLDLARYADTHGGSAIGFTKFPFSYTYRDYVIHAFNADLPYDRFVTEQLAADQLGLDEHDPASAALGFLTIGMQYRNRHDVIDDQIDVISRGLMGLTVACARCHDHKFDPISTEDYYGLYATLASSRAPDELPVIERPKGDEPHREYLRELARRQASHDDMAAEQNEVMRGRLRMQVGMYLREIAKGAPEQDTSTAFLSYRTDDFRPIVLNRWRDYMAKMSDADPVFGPWVRLSRLGSSGFREASTNLVRTLEAENGDPTKFKDLQKLATEVPRWNPKVLEVITKKLPGSMMDVADAYGELFASLQQGWLKSLQNASAEAAPGAEIVPDEDRKQLEINSAVNRQLRRHLYASNTPTAIPDDLAVHLLNRTVNDNLSGRRGAIHDHHLNSPGSPPRAMALKEDPSPEPFHVLKRGNPLDRGVVAPPRFLSVLASTKPEPFPDGKRRLGLARALVAPENPLTRRVLVNWVWQHHFGQGLVRTPDDWGTRGKWPTHPELLDYLASVFTEDGWSLKKLHRRIMLSATYAQAAVEDARARAVDPDNELLWRMPRRRLDLESMLDSMLAVSGELDLSLGGRPFDRQAQPGVLRRSVYAFVNRDIVSSLSSTFDGANPSSCTAKRPDTNVPQQTLFALNSEFIQDRAAALATLTGRSAGDDDTRRIRELFVRVFSREPQPAEQERLLKFKRATAAASPESAWQQVAHVLLAANEFAFVD